MFRLDGKVAVVTGGTRGIGLATSRVLLQAGAGVVMASRNETHGEEAVSEFQESLGQGTPVSFHPVEVSDPTSVKQLFDRVLESHGRVDVLVNNAAVMNRQDILEVDEAEWDRILAINAKGPFLCCRAVLPAMIEQGGGTIVNLCSVLSFTGGQGNTPAYNASKGALLTFTKTLAVSYGPRGVRANAVCPGFVPTDLNRHLVEGSPEAEAYRRELLAQYPLHRLGRPEDVAHAVLFLASDEAGWINGAVLTVDGGFTAA